MKHRTRFRLLMLGLVISMLLAMSAHAEETAVSLCEDAHNWGTPVLDWSEGEEPPDAIFTCSSCGKTMRVYTSMDYDIIQNPTCTKDGSAHRVIMAYYDAQFTAGGEEPDWVSDEMITLPATGHLSTNYTDNLDGTHAFACVYCSGVFTESHEYENGVCTACGSTAHAHVHSFTAKVTAPTCTEKGYTTHTCACGESYVDSEKQALGHSFTNYVYNNDAQIGKDGTETAKCSRCDATDTRTKVGSALPDPNPDNPFVDVAPGKFYYQPVLWAVEKGITNGITATTFAPGDTCTRGQVVTFLWRAAGKPEPKSTNNPFTDVIAGKYYYKAVLWAVEQGITSGMTKTTFEPNSPCTRSQVVTFQWRAAGKPEPKSANNPFTDVKEGKFYSKAVLWAVENGITSGMTKTTFVPDNVCTRGQIVTFLYRQYS